MNNLKHLITGEVVRMQKYNILAASLVVAFIWIAVLHITAIEEIGLMLVVVLFFDVTAMASLLVGVAIFFEKQESTIKTLLISPISKEEYITSKIGANLVSGFFTLVLLLGYAYFVRDAQFQLLYLAGAVGIGVVVNSMIGFLLTYRSRDFTGLLMNLIGFNILLLFPVIFELFGLIQSDLFSKALYVLPTKAILTLMLAAVNTPEPWEIYLSLGYMLILSVVLFRIIVTRFDEFSIRESGV